MEANNKRHWKYISKNGHVDIVYLIDGVYRTEHESAQYLMDTYKMTVKQAYTEIASISH